MIVMRAQVAFIFLHALLSTSPRFQSAGASAKLSEPFVVSPPAEGRPQYFPRASWSAGAKVWLVVWQEGDPTEDGTGEARAQDILAARVSADGKVLDIKPIEIAAVKGAQQRPMVASDGDDFLVVWHDFRNGKNWDVYASRVTGGGKVLDKGGTLIAGGERNQCFADVVFGGGNYYAAWLDMRHWPEYRVYGSRVSREGKALDAGGVELVRVMSDEEMEAWKKAPFAPGKLGLGWHNFGQRGMRGVKQPGPPSLGTDGATVVVVSEIHEESSKDIALRAVARGSGQPKGGLRKIAIGGNSNFPYLHWSRMSVVAAGGGFLVGNHLITGSWGSGPGSWMTVLLDAEGAPVDGKPARFHELLKLDSKVPPGYRAYGNRHIVLSLVWGDRGGLFVCENHEHSSPSRAGPGTPGNIDVLALAVDAEGRRVGDAMPMSIASGPTAQSAPGAAAGPDGSFLVVWQEESPGLDSRVMARWVNAR